MTEKAKKILEAIRSTIEFGISDMEEHGGKFDLYKNMIWGNVEAGIKHDLSLEYGKHGYKFWLNRKTGVARVRIGTEEIEMELVPQQYVGKEEKE